MTANYPRAVRTYSSKRNFTDIIDDSHVNELQEEVLAIQKTLGTTPTVDATIGTEWPDVKTRIEAARRGLSRPMWTLAAPRPLGSIAAQVGQQARGFPVDIPMTTGNWTPVSPVNLRDAVGVKIARRGWYFASAQARFDAQDVTGVRSVFVLHTNKSGVRYTSPAGSFFYRKGDGIEFAEQGVNSCMVMLCEVGDTIRLGASVGVSAAYSGTRWNLRNVSFSGGMIREGWDG